MSPRSVSLLTILLLAACEGPAGKDGANGVDGADGANGADGSNGADGVDGADGEDGSDGVNGADGEDGEDLVGEPESLSVVITGVEIAGPPVVSFTVVDQDGAAFDGLTGDLLTNRNMRFTMAHLSPGADGDADSWQNYLNTTEDTSSSTVGPDGVPVLASATQATTENTGTLTSLGDGLYTYTFATDVTAVTTPVAVEYDETLLHRVVMQLEYPLESGEELIYNPTYDWVPSGADAPATRDIVSTASCNECHGELALHGGGRVELDYCVTCHNPGTTDANSGIVVDMSQMVHKIHMGNELPSVADSGGTYTIWGYGGAEHDYSHVGYPQDQENCIKCHDPDDSDTPDAGNYLTRPTMEACGSCHDDVDFATGENHLAGAMTSNASCALCHTDTAISEYHLTENATPHNPELPAGLSEFEYEVISATVDSDNTLTVEYTITRDGTAVDCSNLDSDITDAPTFLLAWAEPIDGFDTPADWNNLGNKAGQPTTVSVESLVAGDIDGGQHSYSGGVNTMVYADAFPEGAMMRTVALQGYYSQVVEEEGEEVEYGRHAISKYMTVDGDDARRQVADSESCASCHEWFEAHGGNRVYEVQVCAMCHNPALSSSGRELDLENPEASNNFKDLVHGIHGASVRDTPLDFVRNRSGGTRYTFLGDADQLEEYPDGHVIEYPNDPANCTTCHIDETYLVENLSADAVWSTAVMGPDAASTTDYTAYRESTPNDVDLVVGVASAACSSCHNSEAALAHMDQNGGAMLWTRDEVLTEEPFETCSICHSDGSVAPVAEVHGL